MSETIGGNSKGLTWNAVTQNNGNSAITDLAGYRVYKGSGLEGDEVLIAETVETQHLWPVFPLNHGETATFFVKAFDAAGNESAPSMTLTLTADLLAPQAPTGLAQF